MATRYFFDDRFFLGLFPVLFHLLLPFPPKPKLILPSGHSHEAAVPRCCERACPRCPVYLFTTTSLENEQYWTDTNPSATVFFWGGTPWVRDWRSNRQHNFLAYRPGCISPRESPASHSTHSRPHPTQSPAWLASRPVRGRSGVLTISLCVSRQSQYNNNSPSNFTAPKLRHKLEDNALVLDRVVHQCSY